MAAPDKRISLDKASLDKLLRNPEARQSIPLLASLKNQQDTTAKAAGCCRKKARGNSTDLAKVKKQIAKLPPEQKLLLKTYLGASQVVVEYTNGKGVPVKLRF